ncbi:hypothetical protein FRX31_015797 [Thalictrum thalictroides]|uniref:Uncharacterized protein n=1 Tax=Thalictrum thalictroides TaxID=46969 RepID=A0A7J6WB04_THATH|nr:hypothetical protein FRX31_015797 [Thalictrum thalictroides]
MSGSSFHWVCPAYSPSIPCYSPSYAPYTPAYSPSSASYMPMSSESSQYVAGHSEDEYPLLSSAASHRVFCSDSLFMAPGSGPRSRSRSSSRSVSSGQGSNIDASSS